MTSHVIKRRLTGYDDKGHDDIRLHNSSYWFSYVQLVWNLTLKRPTIDPASIQNRSQTHQNVVPRFVVPHLSSSYVIHPDPFSISERCLAFVFFCRRCFWRCVNWWSKSLHWFYSYVLTFCLMPVGFPWVNWWTFQSVCGVCVLSFC